MSQKAGAKTKASTLYKYVRIERPRSGSPERDSGLTARDVDQAVQHELSAVPCQWFVQRNYTCSYRLTTQPPDPATKPADPADPAAPDPGYVVVLTPEQAAQIAVATLQLPVVPPGIGPDPEINEWKMAAVGYPLWLWADGPHHVGPVSQAVANLSVSLDATLASVSYQMGDGHTVICSGPGTPWTRTVTPGQPSRCGYRYTRPSLPEGTYTVRALAHWEIAWTIGTTSGIITMDVEGTRLLPVGELQVLVR